MRCRGWRSGCARQGFWPERWPASIASKGGRPCSTQRWFGRYPWRLDKPIRTGCGFSLTLTYLALCWEAVDRPAHEDVSQRIRRLLRMRSFVTIAIFAAAALVALRWPVVVMALICLCLVGYLRPDIPAPNKGAGTA